MHSLIFKPLAFVVLTTTVLGCTHIKTRADLERENKELTSRRAIASVSGSSQSSSMPVDEDELQLDDDAADIGLPPISADTTASEQNASAAIHVEMNPEIQKWIQYFTVKDRERFQRFLNRGDQYREAVEATLKANGLPADFYYLAMIESGYRTDAHSIAKAVGVWQFIPGTADRYGLRVDRYVDERRDPIRATQAAARYLKDLYNVFGSWHLAMSAYNAGEIRVLRAVFRGKSRDFWALARNRVLPRETSDYVPKFLAVVHIGENPSKYGFTIERPRDIPNSVGYEAPGSLSLSKIAELSGASFDDLKLLNPHLMQGRTPVGAPYKIWVPESQIAKVQAASSKYLAAVERAPAFERHDRYQARSKKAVAKSDRGPRALQAKTNTQTANHPRVIRYKVKSGDNLTDLSKKFGVPIGSIKQKNRIKRNTLFRGEVLKIELPH